IVDKRTDIFAFGCVLYEMLTSKRTFDGEDVSEIIGSILKMEPDWRALPPGLSPQIREIIELCLQKTQNDVAGMRAISLLTLNAQRIVRQPCRQLQVPDLRGQLRSR